MDIPAGQYLGKPCKRAHSGLRYLSNKNCVECSIERERRYREAKPEAVRERARRYREANVGAVRERNRQWREANAEAVREYRRQYHKANAEAAREYGRQWREANAEVRREYRRQWREANAEVRREYGRQWREKNADARREYDRQWREANPAKANAIGAKRRAAKLQATPGWLTEQHFAEIEAVYAEAKARSQEIGEAYHVDHIVPLQGKNVCGLHVPWNLRAIPAVENIAKRNKHDDADINPQSLSAPRHPGSAHLWAAHVGDARVALAA